MDEWQELQRREQALSDKHRSDKQALQHEFMLKHDELERHFELNRQAIESAKAQCMVRMAAQAAAAAAGHPAGPALLQWPSVPALAAVPSPMRLGAAPACPAADTLHRISGGTADSSATRSDAATLPATSQDASQELISDESLHDDDEDDAISGNAFASGSEASGISLSQPGSCPQPSMQAAPQPSDQQADSRPAAQLLQSSQQLPADEQQGMAAAAPGAAGDIISSPNIIGCMNTPALCAAPSPASSLPAATSLAAERVQSAAAPDTATAAGSLQVAVSQLGPASAGKAKRVQPTKVGDARKQPSPAAAVSDAATDDDGAPAAGTAPNAATAALTHQQGTLAAVKPSEVMAVLHSRAPGGCHQLQTNVPELAWAQARPKVHRMCDRSRWLFLCCFVHVHYMHVCSINFEWYAAGRSSFRPHARLLLWASGTGLEHDLTACSWKACGTQRPLPRNWKEALSNRQLRGFQQVLSYEILKSSCF